MKTLYKNGLHDAAQEEKFIRQALLKIQEIRNIRNETRMQVSVLTQKFVDIIAIFIPGNYCNIFFRQDMMVAKKHFVVMHKGKCLKYLLKLCHYLLVK